MNKKEQLKSLIKKLHNGLDREEARRIFRRDFGQISTQELAKAEGELVEEGMPIEEIQRLCDIHASVFEDGIQFLPRPQQGHRPQNEIPGHPAFIFQKENEGLEAFIDNVYSPALNAFDGTEPARETLVAHTETLAKVFTHYVRKETLLFPLLEREGILAPPKVMWGVDDENRALFKSFLRDLATLSPSEAASRGDRVLEALRSMIQKENNILLPMMMDHFHAKDWVLIAEESRHIGLVFTGALEGASPSDAAAWLERQSAKNPSPSLVLSGPITLPSGVFEPQELTCLLNTLPCDLTFVGADDRVHYFSEGAHRVFPRTRSIIGREVANCHPPKSLPLVERLIQEFKDGTKDSESFWLQKAGAFILIRYYAVRDEENTYLGVLEVTEEISGLRSLTGQKTLLS
ncbi:hypothetical protein ABB02_00583 [Clostridiaceae bacterium JG1575]|nr:hypothetical protein ABB02_00583 [Clostridiaceae bacterium JG1575]